MTREPPAGRSVREPARLTELPRHDIIPAALPGNLTSLIGREREIAAIGDLIGNSETRLLTLTGPGGVGKTRLALRVAEETAPAFPDGVWFVNLAPIANPDLVTPTIAQALGLREASPERLADRLTTFFSSKRALLLLDNLEQVIEGVSFIVDLLRACPRLTVLATSRTRLSLSGEREYNVPPLEQLQGKDDFEDARRSAAVRLFVERAQAVKDSFVLTPENAETIAAICGRLDGLPLAIELAAARVKVLSPAELLTRLEHRLPLLTGGSRDLPLRQQTMWHTIAWSYDLLPEHEQRYFCHAAIFVAGFDLTAAEAVIGNSATSSSEVLDVIASLIDKNLLHRTPSGDGQSRFTMLETVREFALGELKRRGDGQHVAARHADYYLHVVEHLWPGWFGGSGVAARFDQLETERDNLRAALVWAEQRGEISIVARITHFLRVFWAIRGPVSEGLDWLNRVLTYGAQLPLALRVDLWCDASYLAYVQGDLTGAANFGQQALDRAQAADEPILSASAKYFLGIALHVQNRDTEAQRLFEEALSVFRARNEEVWLMVLLDFLGIIEWRRGNAVRAEEVFNEALTFARAKQLDWAIGRLLGRLGLAATDLGEHERAAACYREGLQQLWEIRDQRACAALLTYVAALIARHGDPVRAARLCGAIETLLTTIGTSLDPAGITNYNRAIETARSRLPSAKFQAAIASGQRMTLEQACHAAMTTAPDPVAVRGDLASQLPLTMRELEVLRLLVDGYSDAQIASTLFISRRTAATHVSNIFRKLDVNSRAAAAVYAVREGLA